MQEVILNTIRRERIPVTVHLTNGVPLKGIIRGFDNYVVIIEGDGKQMMVYKHAISTVTPLRQIQLNQGQGQPQAGQNEPSPIHVKSGVADAEE